MGRFALHFDQQYDTIKIELDRGEEFFMTVKEAEDKGYRRAWRLRGNKAANYLSGEDNFLGGWGQTITHAILNASPCASHNKKWTYGKSP